MKTRVLMATAALAAAVMWTAPSASASSPYCDALPPKDAHDCNCGFDFDPGSQELHDCMSGNAAVVPAPPAPPSP
jgi:hypothetical protein